MILHKEKNSKERIGVISYFRTFLIFFILSAIHSFTIRESFCGTNTTLWAEYTALLGYLVNFAVLKSTIFVKLIQTVDLFYMGHNIKQSTSPGLWFDSLMDWILKAYIHFVDLSRLRTRLFIFTSKTCPCNLIYDVKHF